MISWTTLGTDRFEIEVPVLWVKPDPVTEGESSTAWSGTLRKSRIKRWEFEIEFVPFVNNEVPDGITTFWNSQDFVTMCGVLSMSKVWISEPEVSGRTFPDRYFDDVNFPDVAAFFPRMVECDDPSTTKTDEGMTEVTMLAVSRYLD